MIKRGRIHTLTPVHIGCDQSYIPINFVIDTDRRILKEFDLWDFINSLNESDWRRLSSISENRSPIALVHLYRFYAERKNMINGRVVPIPVELAERYREVKQLQNEKDVLRGFNEFEIPKTFYDPYTGKPLIPGSSIKGSIRTAYVEGLIKQRSDISTYRDTGRYRKYTDIEEEILQGKTRTDPFRLLKISDFEPEGEVKTEILFQINVRKLNSTLRPSLSLPIEIIPPNSVFTGLISVEEPLPSSGISQSIELFDLLLKTHFHYATVFNREVNLKKQKGFKLPDLSEFMKEIKKKYFLLRLGKHSGAEAVTWEGLRRIRVRTREGFRTMESPTTIWLASEKKRPVNLSDTMPFGWAILEVV